MMILGQCNGCESRDRESLASFWRAQTFVWARLMSFNCDAGDFRWTMVALVLRGLGAVAAFGQRQLDMGVRNVLHRAWQGARFAAEMRDADSMVAAGSR